MFNIKVDHEIELHLLQLNHAEELFWLVQRNRSYLREWLPWVDEVISPIHFQHIIPIWLRRYANNEGLNAGIRYNGILIGSISINNIDWSNRCSTIGYYLDQHANGKGIMTRSVNALIKYMFFHLKLNRIEIRCGEKNYKSQAIPKRLGFQIEGTMRQGEYLYGRFHDLIVYSLLFEDWDALIRGARNFS